MRANATFDDGKKSLCFLLSTHLPRRFRTGEDLDVKVLSHDLKCSYETIYKWLRKNRIAPRHVVPLVRLSRGGLTTEDLMPFVLNV